MKTNRLDILLAAALNDKPEDQIKYTNISIEEAAKLFKTEYSNSFEATQRDISLFRGDVEAEKKKIKCVLAVPGMRKSENTINIYTKLMSDVLPSWSKYPKRNRSFICSLDFRNATTFSSSNEDVFSIFPKNNTKIGICAKGDLWTSFLSIDSICSDMSVFNDCLDELFGDVYAIVPNIPRFINESAADIKKYLSQFDAAIREKESHREEKMPLYDFAQPRELVDMIVNNIMAGGSTFDLLNDKILNPDNNGFDVVDDVLQINGDMHYESEVWFSGECIMIHGSVVDEVLRHVKQ